MPAHQPRNPKAPTWIEGPDQRRRRCPARRSIHEPRTTNHFLAGFTLVETMVVLAIISLVAVTTLPDLLQVRRRSDHLRLTRQIASDTLACRIAALTGCRNVGLVFAQQHGKWYYTMVADRDGDGVSRRDFTAGVDTPLGPKTWLEFLSYDVLVGVPRGWRVPDPAGAGQLSEDGMRTGNSNIISFSHLGHATPCTVYFNDGRERMLAVRINGSSGVIRVLAWQRGWEAWREVVL
jgi:prepilin-type N-terminal cleavage/methylation domain-containing protein